VETNIPVDKLLQGGDADAASGPGCEDKEPYVLMVLGDSMEPEFMEGDVVVIEPGAHYRDGSYVIAYHNEEYIFRQLRVINERMYLTPLNPAYVSEQIDGAEAIKGVITQKKRPGGGRQNRKNYV
jgi:phage repressor protein C with HTH and peptisase S24 domain